MKKKIKKQTHRTSHSKTVKPLIPSKIVIISSTFFAVLLTVVVIANKRTVEQSVQGAAIVKGLFAEATVSLPQVSGASTYNIYYGETLPFTHAVRNIPADMTTYTIQYLKKGVDYQYRVSGVNPQGREIWFSQVVPLTNIQGM